ncbi:MAG TPA: hypothetical protein VGN95_22210 [Pyrinomonadaceae bacterium]|nr:hypothetical protein [Pyrinomonadaceae bacterium]
MLLDSQAFAHQASVANKSQSAGFTQGNQRAPVAQSKQYAKLNTWPLADFVSRVLKIEKRATQPAHSSNLLFFFVGASGRTEELIYKNLHAPSSRDEVITTFSMPRETFCALLSKYLSSY